MAPAPRMIRERSREGDDGPVSGTPIADTMPRIQRAGSDKRIPSPKASWTGSQAHQGFHVRRHYGLRSLIGAALAMGEVPTATVSPETSGACSATSPWGGKRRTKLGMSVFVRV